MKTQVIKIDPINPDPDKIKDAALVLANGGLVAFPTETVYGLGANMRDEKALARLYEVKKRPQDKPFSIHIARKEEIENFAVDIAPFAWRIVDRFLPGPLTLVLKGKDKHKVGFRMPNNRLALSLILEARVPVVAPSANISGNPPPKNAEDVLKDLGGHIEVVIDGGPVELGIESTVADLTSLPIKILRDGAISKEALEKISESKEVLFVCTGNSCRSVMAKYLLEKELSLLNKNNVSVLSCGVSAIEGMSATPFTLNLIRADGIEIKKHEAIRLKKQLVRRADIILVMENLHKEEVLRLYPEAKEKNYLLGEFADNLIADIHDPIGKSEEEYGKCFLQIKELVKKAAAKI
ncbi:MAG: L-threonylcarbamoyladenylate synthase [Candidatus Omnitrophota bacterium]|nr:L-threonylcarbamoyladenylate synthase [Candidatus Omnitrophota bacterium]